MCNAYYLSTPPAKLMDLFGLTDAEAPVLENPRFAPTDQVPVVLNVAPRRLSVAKWGLIPFWAQDPKVGVKMFNARAEGIAEKPAFRAAVQRKRCLVLADGFYEWRKNPDGTKTPIRYALESGRPFAFAGLWELWRPPAMDPVRSCTIITTQANPLVAPIHDRMPVILERADESLWLKADEESIEEALALLQPYPADRMTATELPQGIPGARPPRSNPAKRLPAT